MNNMQSCQTHFEIFAI